MGLSGSTGIEFGVGAAAFAIATFAGMAGAWLEGRCSPARGVETVVAEGRGFGAGMGRLPLDHV